MVRPVLCLVLVVFALFFTGAEELPPGEALPDGAELPAGTEGEDPSGPGAEDPELADFFPVLSLYGAALAGEVPWRPDWPLSMPPDAFSFPPYGGSVLTLIKGGEDPAGEPAEELTVSRNEDGLLAEFPLFRDGVFFQVQTRFGRASRIRGFTIPAAETSWDILIVEYEDAFPSLVRISRGETLYFALIEYEAAGAAEIWYNREGNALAVFSYRYEAPGGRIRCFVRTDLSNGEEFTETYHYDGMGNLSGIVTSAGEYSALYVGKGRPRYWERFVPAGPEPAVPADAGQPDLYGTEVFDHFSFQWDEGGLPVRFTGSRRAEDAAGTGEVTETDVRYEYIRDEQGAWIERRATPMIRRSGFLVPGPAERFLRRIGYSAP
ncbi:MAG: hypothetical protein LBH57_07320 [Treponema sp.]|jgi:hypothetical protein|nr:hypothetical protein [Treponema sp.]